MGNSNLALFETVGLNFLQKLANIHICIGLLSHAYFSLVLILFLGIFKIDLSWMQLMCDSSRPCTFFSYELGHAVPTTCGEIISFNV